MIINGFDLKIGDKFYVIYYDNGPRFHYVKLADITIGGLLTHQNKLYLEYIRDMWWVLEFSGNKTNRPAYFCKELPKNWRTIAENLRVEANL